MRAAVKINVPRILSFVIIAIVIAGVVNVYADAGPIERMARARVCERHPVDALRYRGAKRRKALPEFCREPIGSGLAPPLAR